MLPHATLASVQLLQLDELPALRVRNDYADALISLQGAQVLEFIPRGQRPIIWLSEQAAFKRGENIRGGIPVCWPWFGELARNPAAVCAMTGTETAPAHGAESLAHGAESLAHGAKPLAHGAKPPAHGLVRAKTWLLETIVEQPTQTQIILRYPTAALHNTWPQAAELTLTISVGAALRLQLATRNTGATPITLTQALHTYFAISDIEQIELRGFEDTRYIDTLNEWREFSQRGALRIAGEVDRIYQQVPEHVRLSDVGWQRSIHLRARHSASAVVWNPHIEKSKRLNQLAGDAWRRMVCIETANVLDDAVALAAGAEQVLDVEIWSEDGAV